MSEQLIQSLIDLDEQELTNRVLELPKHVLCRLHAATGAARKIKYNTKQVVRSINLPKSFTSDQLDRFFIELSRFRNHRVCIAFLLALAYGLRVSEIGNLSIVPGQRLICIDDKKMKRKEYLPLVDYTKPLIDYYNSQPPLNKDYLRKYFIETLYRLGDEFTYNEPGKVGQRNHQFTTHSLRHTAGAHLLQSTNSEFKMHVYLRHNLKKSYGTTGYYMHYRIEEMRTDANNCFAPLVKHLLGIMK